MATKKKIQRKSATKKTTTTKKVLVKTAAKPKNDKKRVVKSFKSQMTGDKLKELLGNKQIKNAADVKRCGKSATITILRDKLFKDTGLELPDKATDGLKVDIFELAFALVKKLNLNG